jgi:hypothetical protein
MTTTQNTGGRKSVIFIPEAVIENTESEELIIVTAPILYEIYKVYFPHEFSMSVNENFMKDSSFKSFNNFNKEFDLCPSIVNKSITFQIWQTETLTENEESTNRLLVLMKNVDLKKNNNNNVFGRYFDFFKFIRSIMKISEISFERMEINLNRKLNTFEKMCLLFERMELSEGFLSIEKKTAKTHNKKTSVILPKEIADRVKYMLFDKKDNFLNVIVNLIIRMKTRKQSN